ncbi:hypothetical protein N7491_001633 [Penicillium cf. griseofulvum]|nr:hypothetical protein N7491_001633 [Penicillium cf. griseofulvum]
MNANPISMSIRTAMSLGRLNPAAPSLAGALRPLHQTTPRASKQLTRFSSTTARPAAATLNLDSRPHIKAALPSSIALRANSTSAPANNEVKLDWDSFFKLRASRRRYSLVSSVASSAISTSVGVQVLSGQDLEHLGATVMGLDPFIVLGLATAAKYKPSVNTKEKEFFDRIRRFRVDPSTNSIANPVPDYYGEKIGSVAGYRNWLKDQRAYNRKRRNFIA